MPEKSVPLVSVIIPCYNAQDTIRECLTSILDSQYSHFEIIVIDDCSGDETRSRVSEIAKNFPQIKLVKQKENGGPAKGRNTGASNASGDILFFVDSDTTMLPDAIERAVQRLQTVDAAVGVYATESINRAPCARYKAMLTNYYFSRNGIIPYEVFDSSRAAIRADIFHKEGGFNESLEWGMDYENEEFGYRLCEKYQMILDPSIQVKHYFPNFKKMTVDYFFRVALWVNLFLTRKRFESGGVTTGGMGASSVALLGSIVCLLAGLFFPIFFWAAFMLFGLYLSGYLSFFNYVARRRLDFLPAAIAFNLFFTLIISCGAFWGLIKTLYEKWNKSGVTT